MKKIKDEREKIEEFIQAETHRLEEFSDIEICSCNSRRNAERTTKKMLDGYTEEEIHSFYEAVFCNNEFEEFVMNGWKDRNGNLHPTSVYQF